jgi:hypothetical protein
MRRFLNDQDFIEQQKTSTEVVKDFKHIFFNG